MKKLFGIFQFLWDSIKTLFASIADEKSEEKTSQELSQETESKPATLSAANVIPQSPHKPETAVNSPEDILTPVKPESPVNIPVEEAKMEYSDKFNKCVEFVFDREGRFYENNPLDSGGETKYGISKKAFPELDIKNLTEEQAKEIYHKNYWTLMNCENYEIRFALCLFDTAVNQGVWTAKSIQDEFGNDMDNVDTYLLKRLRRYFNLCQKNPKLFIFLKDWVLRILRVAESEL